MRLTHFNSLRLALALVAALAALCLWAQDDTPIIISDGSLTLESAVPWPRFTNLSGNSRAHPNAGKAIASVAITMPGHNQTITFSNQRCTVTVSYAGTDVTVDTGNNGRGLRVNTDFSQFQRGATDNQLVHRTTNAKISRVVVVQGNTTVFNNTAAGGTRIVISYR